jgi:hypothetical protein
MAAAGTATQAGFGWAGRAVVALAVLGATAVATTVPAYAPAGVLHADTVADTALDAGGTGTGALYVVVVPDSTADFAVVETAPATAGVGARTGYRLAVTNLAAAVGQTRLTGHLPVGFEVEDVDSEDCAVGAGGTVRCMLTVPGLTTETVTVSGVFLAAGTVANTASVFSDGDVNPGNDRSTAITTVTGDACPCRGTP